MSLNNRKQLAISMACLLLALSFDAHDAEYPPRHELLKSVDRAVEWLTRSTREHWQPDTSAMVQYLNRKFPESEMEELRLEASVPFSPDSIDKASFPPPFFRLIDPGQIVGPVDIASLTNRITNMTAKALHCDRHPVDPDFISDLDKMSRYGGYSLTHALLAARWAVENGCLEEHDLSDLSADLIQRLETLVEKPGIPDDLKYESMAMLYYAGARQRIKSAWILDIVETQQQDGGWLPARDWKEPSHHTTFLAIWVLLETLFPDSREVPMIPKRVQQHSSLH